MGVLQSDNNVALLSTPMEVTDALLKKLIKQETQKKDFDLKGNAQKPVVDNGQESVVVLTKQ